MGILGSDNSSGMTWGDLKMPAIPPELAFQQALNNLRSTAAYASAMGAPGANTGEIWAKMAQQNPPTDLDVLKALEGLRGDRLSHDNLPLTGDQIKASTEATKQQTQQNAIAFAQQQAVQQLLERALNGGSPLTTTDQAVTATAPASGSSAPVVTPTVAPVMAAPDSTAPTTITARAAQPDPFGISSLTPQQKMQILMLPPEKRAEMLMKMASKSFEPITIKTNDGRELSYAKMPDGRVVPIDQVLNTGKADNSYSSGKMSENEATSAGYADRMARAHSLINSNVDGGMSSWANAGEGLPIIGRFQSEQNKLFQQARDDFVTAMLRRESGAAISPTEYAMAYKSYIPQPGDSDAVLAQKARARAEMVQSNMRAAGPNYKPPTAWGDGQAIDAHSQLGSGGTKLGIYGGRQFETLPDGRVRLVGVGK